MKKRQAGPEYWVWAQMLQRCRNQKCPEYKNYGARGITVCESWRSYGNFIADMGPRPSAKHSLDRKNNDGNYEPSNCRWADSKSQTRNMRRNTVLELNGERKLLCEWAAHTGISAALICNRLDKMRWSVERALTTPPDTSKFRPRTGLIAKARAAGVKINTFYARMRRGLSVEEALKP